MSYLQRLPWPLPALLSWGLCWLALSLLLRIYRRYGTLEEDELLERIRHS